MPSIVSLTRRLVVAAYKLFVEIGRLVTFKQGALKGKVGVIVDIIDVHRVMVESADIEKRQAHLTDLELQKPVVKIARNVARDGLLSALKEQKTIEAYQATSAYKRTQRQERRATLTDFERFVARKLRKQRATLIRAEYKGLLKTHKEGDLVAVKAAAKKSRIAKHNAKNSYKNLGRKINKRVKARKAFEARVQKRTAKN